MPSELAAYHLADGWKWIFGLLGLTYVLVRRTPPRGRPSRIVVHSAAIFLGTLLVRSLFVESGFFQHVGRGPLFLCIAHDPVGLPYGPGLHELYGFVGHVAPDAPEALFFAAQVVVGAILPAAVFATLRALGATARGAAVVALVFAMLPGLARGAASESYYVPIAALISAAVLALVVAHRRPAGEADRWVGSISAALLLAQAVAIHPVGWLQASAVPLVAGVGRGRRASKWRSLVHSCGVAWFAIAVQLASEVRGGSVAIGESNLAQLHGTVWFRLGGIVVPLAVALVGGLIALRWHGRARARGILATALVALQAALQIIGIVDLPRAGAYLHAALIVPPLLAVLATCPPVRGPYLLGRPLLTLALAAVVVDACFTGRDQLRHRTETLEAAFLVDLRAHLPRDAEVVYVESKGEFETVLPFYGACGLPGPTAVPVAPGAAPDAFAGSAPRFYLHSSLCSTPLGRAACDEFERGLVTQPIATTQLEASSDKVKLSIDADGHVSREPFRYLGDSVSVRLERIVGTRPRP